MDDELVHHGRFLDYLQRDGWEFVRRTNASAVVAIAAQTPDGAVVLVEQTRRPLGEQGRRVIEPPAGLVGDDGDHDLLAATQRELEEETGFRAGQLALLPSGPTSAGVSDEVVTFVAARELERVGGGGGVGDEAIRVHLVPRDAVDDWLLGCHEAGLLVDPKVWAVLYFLDRLEG